LSDLAQYLAEQRVRLEAALRSALDLKAGCPASLREAMAYSLLAPGKRLRPILVLLATEACGGGNGWPAACAVEMVHVYSLIHDDLPAMDDDDLRRGQPTCHKKFGEALAILAGDALLTLAFETLASYPPSMAGNMIGELARAAGACGMVGGQADDLAWEQGGGTIDDLEHLHARKTGALFLACLRLGALAATNGRPDPALWANLDGYGRCFGLAFQITDDLLDVQGHAEQAGKRVHKDAARGKLTYPALIGLEESRYRAESLCRTAADHLRPLGRAGDRLAALLPFILERNR
jgi:geranylgeranyl diphosphate synthase type II